MKFSEKWLREWVNPSVDSETLAEQLTMAGLEVDARQAVAADFSQVLVGKVVHCEPHPNADKLRVTKVDIGQSALLNIVCGAANCRTGLLVAVAIEGAVLPDNFIIKSTMLRGEPSQGMLCSWRELAIMDEHQGIIELPEDAPIGQNFRDYLQLDDQIIDISLTPNRADCLSIRGIARDLAAVNGQSLTEPVIPAITPHLLETLAIEVSAPQACPHYLTRIIRRVNLQAKTPLWMQEKLRRCGIRSIDPVVDVTNYVMLELGQPIHAFDLEKIQQDITVRFAQAKERLTLLDGNTIELTEDVLVIADSQQPVALAGVFGGQASAVSQQTQHIVLESAYFTPTAIRGRARRYGLHTDSSHRFERGVDPLLQQTALERATALITAICGGEVAPIHGVVNQQATRPSVTLRQIRLQQLLGHQIAEQTVSTILQQLGCQLTPNVGGWQVTAPSWRFDLTIEEDLIEEVARIYGYNRIPNGRLAIELLIPAYQETQLSLKRVKSLLTDRDYQEAITYSFVDPKLQEMLHPQQPMLQLPNPISQEMSAMRLSLWSGLLTAVMHNQRRQQPRVRLFEHGLRFMVDPQAPLGVRQEEMLAAVITGERYQEQWDAKQANVDFYDLKADLMAVLQLTGEAEHYRWRKATHPALHPGQTAAIEYQGELVGYLGLLHPLWEKKLGLQGNTVLFELCWSKIAAGKLPQAQVISRYPANRRDIAVIVADQVMAADILNECKKVGGNQLVGVNLFDVYRGNGVAEGYKSLAISLLLQDNSRTLEEEEITTIVGKCVSALQQQFQASLRD